jgi:xanthine dehydrogenase accessory factor
MIESNERLALATLIGTKGSTPQITGASALFSAGDPGGETPRTESPSSETQRTEAPRTGALRAGTLGGGLLEAEGEKRALHALQSGISVMYECALMSDIADPDGAICGGAAVVLIDAHPERHADAFREMAAALDRSIPGALLTCIGRIGGESVLIARRWVSAADGAIPRDSELYHDHAAEITRAIAERKPVMIDMGDSSSARALFAEKAPAEKTLAEKTPVEKAPAEKASVEAVTEILLFVQPAYPRPQLIITGAGHVGRALAHYGKLLEFEVTVIDDRPELAHGGNIPDADHFIVDDIGEAVKGLAIRPDSYIVIVNRGHRGDAAALRACITSAAAYIGMIGSKRKIGQMRAKFLQEEWCTPGQFDRVHAPVGLSIDAKTVEEIGISIAAELVAERRRQLRGETAP